ncbi:hypothetical protein [Sphingomonas sp. CLY1604]|uniref:hypothetical protein n=1 Tax=Sphingomonas sp. CLY1604 TaxID=3457786 RepID=UPI003FD7F38F
MILSALAVQAAAIVGTGQAYHDDAAAKITSSMRGRFEARGSDPTESRGVTRSDSQRLGWRVPTDEDLRRRSSYRAPRGYRFHRSASVDLDHDGRADLVEMLERSRQTALRISYGSGAVVITNVRSGRWTDQGLFAAGVDAVMVNFPESGAYFLFQRGAAIRLRYLGE